MIDFSGTIDGEPFEGSESRDFTIELGAEGLLAEFDAELVGASAGEERTVEVSFPDDHQPADLAGKTAIFAVTVKEVREKELPDLDDDFVSEASEFETVDELRDDIRTKLGEALEARAEAEFREAAVDAVAAQAKFEMPHEIVHARAHEMWERIERQLAARGIDPQAYAQMQGKRPPRPDRRRRGGRRAGAAPRGGARGGGRRGGGSSPATRTCSRRSDPGEGENDPQKLLDRLRETGRDSLLRDDVRLRKAADVIADSANPIAMERPPPANRSGRPRRARPSARGPTASARAPATPTRPPSPASSGPPAASPSPSGAVRAASILRRP